MIVRCETALKDDRQSLTASGRNLYIAKLSAACLKKGAAVCPLHRDHPARGGGLAGGRECRRPAALPAP